MEQPSSLADLLKLVLSIPAEAPVFATPSFGSWLRAGESAIWPPVQDSSRGLWLIDTRDPDFRATGEGWRRIPAGGFTAALILTGSGQPGSPVRRALRRLRRPGMRRLEEHRAMPFLEKVGQDVLLRRLSFEDGPEVPMDFFFGDDSGSTGAAILLTNGKALSGPLWSVVSARFQDPAFEATSLQLRVRGAAVIGVRSRGRDYVVRAVPPGEHQSVVLRNHTRLTELHGLVRSDTLRHHMPEPVFLEMHGPIALLAESRLAGIPAWKAAGDLRRDSTYPDALGYLSTLSEETRVSGVDARAAFEEHLRNDLGSLEQAAFVDPEIRLQLREELSGAAAMLDDSDMNAGTSHGDFGYGNLLVDPESGRLLGVIDWDTARPADFPGVDRVNLEIQIRRTDAAEDFPSAMRSVWRNSSVQEYLGDAAGGRNGGRRLFGLAVSRYILRSLTYPAIYREELDGFRAALRWLSSTRSAAIEVRA